MSNWKEVNPEGYEATRLALDGWLLNRLDEMYQEKLKLMSEDIQNGKELPKRVPELSRHSSPKEG